MKGVKNSITKESFSKSTLRGVIRKGFITKADLENTSLTDYTKKAIESVDFNLLFIRDKQCLFLLDNKNKVVYDCQSTLPQYLDYFMEKNTDYQKQVLENIHPADLRKRGLSVEKVASENNFTL